MTEKELRRLGETLPIPSPDEKKKEKVLYLSLIALKNSDGKALPDSMPDPPPFYRKPLAWVLTGTLGIVAACLFFKSTALQPGDQKFQVVIEMEKLFDRRLEAMVTQDGNTEIQLSDQDNVSNDQRILITLESNGKKTEVITYSGCKFWVDSGGKRVKIEALAEAGGGILLVGDSFVWDSRESAPIHAGFQIRAKRLLPGNT